jgi:hypothetical protein
MELLLKRVRVDVAEAWLSQQCCEDHYNSERLPTRWMTYLCVRAYLSQRRD